MMRAEFSCERFLIFAATECDCLESHAPRILNAEMSESPDSLDCHNITGTRA